MSRRDARLDIALFLGVTALVLTLLVIFSRNPAFFESGKEFQAVFRNVAGLNRGDEVRYGGLVVGTVSTLDIDTLDATRIRVKFRVRRKTPVHVDSRASITQVGLLGQPYLNLAPGRTTSPLAAPNTLLATDENFSFQDAMTQLARFFERSDTLLGAANEFARMSPFERINVTLNRIDSLVGGASRGSAQLFTRLDSTSVALNGVVAHADRLIGTLDTTVRGATPELASSQRELIATLRETRTLVADLREALKQGGGVDELVRNANVASENLARLSARLERDPTSILKTRQNPKKPAGPVLRE